MIWRPDHRSSELDCCPSLLSKLAADDVDSQQSAWIADHLERCTKCREELDHLTDHLEDWQETRTVLLTETHRNARTNSDLIHYSSCAVPLEPARESAVSPSLVRWLDPVEASTSAAVPCIGSLDGYPIRRILGVGGMGVVLDAWDPSLCRTIAIKAMHPHLAANGTAKQRFVREARSAAAVLHPNVVPIHNVKAEHDPPYLIMPLIAGESLQARIDRDGRLEIDAALRIVMQIADGLSAAHAQGLIHRDIKPANILLEHGTERALLTDFGVVRALNDASMTASGVVAGTPEYMSPEQAGARYLDARSDLFSLGTVFYAMLVGHSPFRAETSLSVLRRIEKDKARPLIEHRTDVPITIQVFVDWMQDKDPDQRIDSAKQLADVCRTLLAHRLDPQRTAVPVALTDRMVSKQTEVKSGYQAAIAMGLILVTAICFLVGQFLSDGEKSNDLNTLSVSNSPRDSSLPTPTLAPLPESTPVAATSQPSSYQPEVARDSERLDREVQRIEAWIETIEKNLKRPLKPTTH